MEDPTRNCLKIDATNDRSVESTKHADGGKSRGQQDGTKQHGCLAKSTNRHSKDSLVFAISVDQHASNTMGQRCCNGTHRCSNVNMMDKNMSQRSFENILVDTGPRTKAYFMHE
jgi:hypothetical protein